MSKILIADDIIVNRILLRQMLDMNGYHVIEANDGKQAIELFETEKPDLILMDVDMPEVDGHEATARIKELSGDNYIPIIFVTAMTSNDSLAKALAIGGDDFIGKPVTVEVLNSKVSAHLRIRDLSQQLQAKNQELANHNQHLLQEHDLVNHFFNTALQQSYLDSNCLKYKMTAMSAFNGDLLLVERGPDGGLYIVIGDFTGHGLSAAMGTLPVTQVFFKMARKGLSLSHIASEINQQLANLLPVEMFFAATLIRLDSNGEKITMWTGGMPDSYWFSAEGKLTKVFKSENMALGIHDDDTFNSTTRSIKVNKGDKLYFSSDGVTETRGPDDEMFGGKRLEKVLSAYGNDRFERTLDELHTYSGVKDQEDDITFVELTCDSVPPEQKKSK
jgi:CheY-like chemotaxis protein